MKNPPRWLIHLHGFPTMLLNSQLGDNLMEIPPENSPWKGVIRV
jgi:hypothetical protein